MKKKPLPCLPVNIGPVPADTLELIIRDLYSVLKTSQKTIQRIMSRSWRLPG